MSRQKHHYQLIASVVQCSTRSTSRKYNTVRTLLPALHCLSTTIAIIISVMHCIASHTKHANQHTLPTYLPCLRVCVLARAHHFHLHIHPPVTHSVSQPASYIANPYIQFCK